MSNIVLFILVGIDLSYPEGIPDVRLVPETRVEDTLHWVPCDIGCRECQES
jgi:hypothetical protein